MASQPKKKRGQRKSATQIPPALFEAFGLLPATPEYLFHKKRKWRIDYAYPFINLGIEIEGGIFSMGRHVRGAGYRHDLEKYNALAEDGWTLLRYEPGRIDWQQIKRVYEALCIKNGFAFNQAMRATGKG
jgi:hypothetical protein